ncbi:MAG: homoserine kinase, partial [Halanaerobiaceae bacterium]|nr:homoserine kinase [Halanaerobiaceae bacterium]
AYKGGLIISVISDNEVIYKKISLAEDIKFVFIIPDFKLKTEELRRVLPASVSLQDAVFNLGRTALLTASLMEKDLGILKVALEDRLHQDYRAELIPGFYNIIETAYQHGACGVCLSGSGPTIMAVADKDEEMIGRAVVNEFKKHGISSTYIVKRADNCGCKIIED